MPVSRFPRFFEVAAIVRRKQVLRVVVALVVLSGGFFNTTGASAQSTGLRVEQVNDGRMNQRWSGSIEIAQSGLYQFSVVGTPSDFWVDGVQLVDFWQDSNHPRFGKLQLSQGNHDVLLEVIAPPGPITQELRWSGPSFGLQPIPNSVLRPTKGNVRATAWSTALKDNAAQRGMLVGTVIAPTGLENSKYRDVLKREFSLAPPEWAFSSAIDQDNQGNLVTSKSFVGPMLSVSEANNQQTMAFHLLWHEFGLSNPFLTKAARAERSRFAKSHVQSLVGGYKGRVGAWVVLNEPFLDNGELRGETVDNYGTAFPNWLFGTSTDTATDPFRWARAADPNAKLYLSEYGIEQDGPKWDGLLELVKRFKREGVPIDGVAFQGHLELGNPEKSVNLSTLQEHFRLINEQGLNVRITELDIGIQGGSGTEQERLQAQGDLVWQMTTACLHAQSCDAVNVWGLADPYSWKSVPQYGGSPANKPTLFDNDIEPKQAYWSMQHSLLRPFE
jgi:endo-1,4-beta-xylanase